MRNRVITLGLVFGLAAALIPAGSAQADGKTFVVDAMNPELECANPDFATINAAVVAATPGDTIVVCPGLYNESVQVNKPDLTIKAKRGPGAWDCFEPAPADPRREAIVTAGFVLSPTTGVSFNITANRAHVQGFVTQGSFFGIRSQFFIPNPALTPTGIVIRDNLMQNNVEGLRFNVSGAEESRVEQNCIRTSNFHGSFGFFIRNARFEHNRFFRNGLSAPGFEGLHLHAQGPGRGAENVTVAHNTSKEDRLFLGVTDATDVRVLHNKAFDSRESAIRLEALNRGVVIQHNELRAGREGIVVSPALAGTPPFFVGPSRDLDISHNDIRDMQTDGIRVDSNGMLSSLVSHNQVMGNGRDGIRIEAGGNAGNRITRNQLMQNAEHDCHDNTVGSGTAGTANVWEDNQAKTENRPGLCAK